VLAVAAVQEAPVARRDCLAALGAEALAVREGDLVEQVVLVVLEELLVDLGDQAMDLPVWDAAADVLAWKARDLVVEVWEVEK
jgi:hypothetical protein